MFQQSLTPYRLPLAVACSIAYNLMFWQEKLGINLFLFSTLCMGILLMSNRETMRSRGVWVSGLGALLTAVLVVVHNSGTAKVGHICSMLLFTGFVHLPQLKTVFHAMGNMLISYSQLGLSIYEDFSRLKNSSQELRTLWSYLKLAVIPLASVTVFFFIFKFANPHFEALAEKAITLVSEWFLSFSFLRIGFWFTGLLISIGVIYNRNLTRLVTHQNRFQDQLSRTRSKLKRSFSFLGLKKEYRTGILLVAMVNALLLINNITDIEWIWFNFEAPTDMSLKQFVHEGTYLLIGSIILSMGIMLYFFRGNQNFFRGNSLLKYLSFFWIFQNIILVISVALRNYHYIDHYGLAYKRIGVFFFLALTLFGLATLFFKIRDRMSAFYLFKTNGWAVYAVMIMLCLVNWDLFIARYNLTHPNHENKVATNFLFSLSDKTLPILWQHPEAFDDGDPALPLANSTQIQRLRKKSQDFMAEWESYSWLSWNWSDYRAYRYLQHPVSPMNTQLSGRH